MRDRHVYRPDIDGLRAIACLVVVAFHFFPEVLPGGFIGVDIFFVISGFLITGIVLSELAVGKFSIWHFYERRIRRIFPALIAVLLVSWTVGYAALYSNEYKQLGKHIAASSLFLSNFAYWQEAGYFDTQAISKPLLNLWSLAIEEQFYVVWPVLMWLVWRTKISFLLVASCATIVSLACNLWFAQARPVDATALFYAPYTRFWELMLGCLLAITAQLRPWSLATDFAKWTSWAGALLLATGLVVTTPAMIYPSGWALLPTLGAVMLIASPHAAFNRKILASKPLVQIGLISYPLYLWHWTLLSFATIVAGGAVTTRLKCLVLAVSFVLSWLTYRWIEQPVKHAKHRSVSWGLLLGLMLTGYLGFNVYDRHGYDFREKGVLRSVAAYEPQRQEDCLQKFQPFKLTFCRISDPVKSIDAVLIGDSHANQYWRGFANQAQAQGFNALNVGWAGMDVVYLPDLVNKKTDEHGRAVDELMRAIANLPTVRHVVLSARQRVDWTPQHDKGLRKVIELMLAVNKRVTYILDNPVLSFHPVSCVGMPPLRPSTNTACSMPVKNIAPHYFKVRGQIKALLTDYPSVQVIDTYPFVCDAMHCQIRREERLLYENTAYFSPIGSVAVFESLPMNW